MKICKDFYTSREVSDSEGFKLAYVNTKYTFKTI